MVDMTTRQPEPPKVETSEEIKDDKLHLELTKEELEVLVDALKTSKNIETYLMCLAGAKEYKMLNELVTLQK